MEPGKDVSEERSSGGWQEDVSFVVTGAGERGVEAKDTGPRRWIWGRARTEAEEVMGARLKAQLGRALFEDVMRVSKSSANKLGPGTFCAVMDHRAVDVAVRQKWIALVAEADLDGWGDFVTHTWVERGGLERWPWWISGG